MVEKIDCPICGACVFPTKNICPACRNDISDSEHAEENRQKYIDREVSTHNSVMATHGVEELQSGLGWLCGAIAIMVLTYALATRGGYYVIAWGAMVYGSLRFAFGPAKYLAHRRK